VSSTSTSDYGTQIRRAYAVESRSVKDQLAVDMTRVITDLSGAPLISGSMKETSTHNENDAIAMALEERSNSAPVSWLGSVLSLWSLLRPIKRRSTTPEKT